MPPLGKKQTKQKAKSVEANFPEVRKPSSVVIAQKYLVSSKILIMI